MLKQGIASLIVLLATGTCVARTPTTADLFEQITGLTDADFGPGQADADVTVTVDRG